MTARKPPAATTVPRRRKATARVLCTYCLGWFEPSRSDGRWCSGACRTATCRALDLPDWAHASSPYIRQESFAEDRKAATGWGLMTRGECYLADLRVRILEGKDVPEHRNQFEALALLREALS